MVLANITSSMAWFLEDVSLLRTALRIMAHAIPLPSSSACGDEGGAAGEQPRGSNQPGTSAGPAAVAAAGSSPSQPLAVPGTVTSRALVPLAGILGAALASDYAPTTKAASMFCLETPPLIFLIFLTLPHSMRRFRWVTLQMASGVACAAGALACWENYMSFEWDLAILRSLMVLGFVSVPLLTVTLAVTWEMGISSWRAWLHGRQQPPPTADSSATADPAAATVTGAASSPNATAIQAERDGDDPAEHERGSRRLRSRSCSPTLLPSPRPVTTQPVNAAAPPPLVPSPAATAGLNLYDNNGMPTATNQPSPQFSAAASGDNCHCHLGSSDPGCPDSSSTTTNNAPAVLYPARRRARVKRRSAAVVKDQDASATGPVASFSEGRWGEFEEIFPGGGVRLVLRDPPAGMAVMLPAKRTAPMEPPMEFTFNGQVFVREDEATLAEAVQASRAYAAPVSVNAGAVPAMTTSGVTAAPDHGGASHVGACCPAAPITAATHGSADPVASQRAGIAASHVHQAGSFPPDRTPESFAELVDALSPLSVSITPASAVLSGLGGAPTAPTAASQSPSFFGPANSTPAPPVMAPAAPTDIPAAVASSHVTQPQDPSADAVPAAAPVQLPASGLPAGQGEGRVLRRRRKGAAPAPPLAAQPQSAAEVAAAEARANAIAAELLAEEERERALREQARSRKGAGKRKQQAAAAARGAAGGNAAGREAEKEQEQVASEEDEEGLQMGPRSGANRFTAVAAVAAGTAAKGSAQRRQQQQQRAAEGTAVAAAASAAVGDEPDGWCTVSVGAGKKRAGGGGSNRAGVSSACGAG
ncbi:hypothetical protein Agub_g9407, partial [Astrephomene gubernaculifera]